MAHLLVASVMHVQFNNLLWTSQLQNTYGLQIWCSWGNKLDELMSKSLAEKTSLVFLQCDRNSKPEVFPGCHHLIFYVKDVKPLPGLPCTGVLTSSTAQNSFVSPNTKRDTYWCLYSATKMDKTRVFFEYLKTTPSWECSTWCLHFTLH